MSSEYTDNFEKRMKIYLKGKNDIGIINCKNV